MKQIDVVKAYRTVKKFEGKDLPLKTSYALFKIKNLIADQVEFQTKQEREIFIKYHPTQNEDGSFKFETEEQAQAFSKEFDEKMKELAEIEVDIGLQKKLVIPLDQAVDMSVADIEALEPFVEFTE